MRFPRLFEGSKADSSSRDFRELLLATGERLALPFKRFALSSLKLIALCFLKAGQEWMITTPIRP